ncbi:MAG: DUF3021 domain-containing protein [Lactobacillus sp.]|jgi:hypothetical protein|nr:DUF3021 domain-containing protein [Lactobacillus sp.]MCH3906147.1 DUF3021 domain-containing protein [Lactobacillus sp.]MCH3990276.1 DUF3021 domain-containing protein [Lactobacillus sp.]MCH4069010.1 DUF3021 domain-containing protein [Lactobacillus sp.]MCI1303412.1 DUF3021 domain-containing protein [Lactobacillus sp.]
MNKTVKMLIGLLISGLIGIGIGVTWNVCAWLYYAGMNSQLTVGLLLKWVVISFGIGVFLSLAGLIFNWEKQPFRLRLILNFFLCLAAWLLLALMLNNYQGHWLSKIISFVAMYGLAYGIYFWFQVQEVRKINDKLKHK